jgi:hypothetical protein
MWQRRSSKPQELRVKGRLDSDEAGMIYSLAKDGDQRCASDLLILSEGFKVIKTI